jgi:hypothetical protein
MAEQAAHESPMKMVDAGKETKKRKVMEPTAHERPMKKMNARKKKRKVTEEQHCPTKTKKILKLAER